MPMYTISTRKPLSDRQRMQAVDLVTDTHCQETGAPEVFVQVVFSQGIPLPKEQCAHILGSIRAGRTEEQKSKMHDRLTNGVAKIMNSNLGVKFDVFDVPHTWAMEGGEMMPEPGTEHLVGSDRY